jgi:hypothetical protein
MASSRDDSKSSGVSYKTAFIIAENLPRPVIPQYR